MAQLCQDYLEFRRRDAEVLAIAPDHAKALAFYWQREGLPFPGLADEDHAVADRFGQRVKLLRFGRLPALLLLDKEGRIRYQHYGQSMSDIPQNAAILALLDQLNGEPPAAPERDTRGRT